MQINVTPEELTKKLNDIANIDWTTTLNRAAILVENDAKLNLTESGAVDTGLLRASITHEVKGGNEAIIGSNLEYAPYIEYGTGLFAEAGDGRKDVPWHYQDAEGNWHSTCGQPPRPYLRPALADNENKIIDLISKQIDREAKKDVRL